MKYFPNNYHSVDQTPKQRSCDRLSRLQARLLSTGRRTAQTTAVIQKRVDIIVTTAFRSWLIVVWMALVGGGIVATVATHANVSTAVVLFGIAVSPALVVLILWDSAPHPTVAEILYKVHTKEGRP